MQRLFEEHLRNMPPAPFHEIVDNPRWAGSAGGFPVPGSAGGTAQIFHIGTPSENTTSEGFRSAVKQRTPSVQSHPTSSPISFGPSTPVQSASASPAGLLSSPGKMSDVGSTLTPPGLPLSDPPRVAGTHGIPKSDPVFFLNVFWKFAL